MPMAGKETGRKQAGLKKTGYQGQEPFRREADADWFTLAGAVGDTDNEQFIIGNRKTEHMAKRSEEFRPFANDLKRLYGNNEGRINLTLTRLTCSSSAGFRI